MRYAKHSAYERNTDPHQKCAVHDRDCKTSKLAESEIMFDFKDLKKVVEDHAQCYCWDTNKEIACKPSHLNSLRKSAEI
jgi:hypothetical protein